MADKYMTVAGAGAKSGVDWANAYSNAEFQTALDSLNGDTLFIEEGTYTQSSILDIDTNAGSRAAPNKIIGVNSSHVEDGTRPVIDANSAAANVFKKTGALHFWHLKHLELINATGNGFDGGSTQAFDWLFYNVAFNNNGAAGMDGQNNIRDSFFVNCEFNSNTSHGILDCGTSMIVRSLAKNNGGRGMSNVRNLHFCIAHNNNNNGIVVSNAPPGTVINCISDGNSSAGFYLGMDGIICINNRTTNNGTYGIQGPSITAYIDNCFFYNNTSGDHDSGDGLQFGDNNRFAAANSSDGYVDRANDDFSITDGEDGTAVEIPIGLLDETANLAYIDQGFPPASAGGGGGLIIHPGMNGGINA